MNHILDYQLFESKQVGILYHYTNITALMGILKTGRLTDIIYDRQYLSFTRNGYGDANLGGNKIGLARLVIDGNLLSEKYRIVPASRASAFGTPGPIRDHKNKQAEERIYDKSIDILRYIVQVDIIDDYAEIDLSKDNRALIESKTTLNIVRKFMPVRIYDIRGVSSKT